MTISGIVWSNADLVIAFARIALKPMTTETSRVQPAPALRVSRSRTDICFAGWLAGTQAGLNSPLIKCFLMMLLRNIFRKLSPACVSTAVRRTPDRAFLLTLFNVAKWVQIRKPTVR